MALIRCGGGDVINANLLACISIATAQYSSSGHARASTFDCRTGEYLVSTDQGGVKINVDLNDIKFDYDYSASATRAKITMPFNCDFYYNDTKVANLTENVEYTWSSCPNIGGEAAQQSQHIYNLRFVKS